MHGTPNYLVEATSFERYSLWRQHAHESPDKPYDWQQYNLGYCTNIADTNILDLGGDNRPITISLTYAKINGQLIAFWESTSQLVDYDIINRWLTTTFPNIPQCDANNFHQCLHFITNHS